MLGILLGVEEMGNKKQNKGPALKKKGLKTSFKCYDFGLSNVRNLKCIFFRFKLNVTYPNTHTALMHRYETALNALVSVNKKPVIISRMYIKKVISPNFFWFCQNPEMQILM